MNRIARIGIIKTDPATEIFNHETDETHEKKKERKVASDAANIGPRHPWYSSSVGSSDSTTTANSVGNLATASC